MRIALRIDVLDRRAAATGVTALLEILRRHHAAASFTCLPHYLDRMKEVMAAGFEVGLITDAKPPWWARRRTKNPDEHEADLRAAHAAFVTALGCAPSLHVAADGQLSPHGLRMTQRLGFACACDTRGRHPYVPVWDGEIVRCPQIPVTLPAFEELADHPRQDLSALCAKLLALTATPSPADQVFAMRARHTLAKEPAPIEELLTGWREQGHEVVSVQTLAARLDMDKLARHEIVVGTVPGRSGTLLLQGDEFLSSWRHPT